MNRFTAIAFATTTALSAGTSAALDAAAYVPPGYVIQEEITVKVENADILESKMWALIAQ